MCEVEAQNVVQWLAHYGSEVSNGCLTAPWGTLRSPNLNLIFHAFSFHSRLNEKSGSNPLARGAANQSAFQRAEGYRDQRIKGRGTKPENRRRSPSPRSCPSSGRRNARSPHN